ncbi:Nn.00g104030.m01.CDS01 [Neocucurbitaria sp. VM-36]
MHRLSQLASLLSLASISLAQIPNIIPFTVTGSLDGCNVEGTEYNAGGGIEVNNFNIKVPKNLIVAFPVVWAPFSELCGAEAGGYETTVVGNIVNGEVIAGQVSVAQRFGLEGSQGYISAINSDGTLQIASGPRVRINDPDGLFGPKTDTKKYWIADTANPSVTSFSGFPMCIPYSGNTDKCKSSNRPNGQTFGPPDPLSMVPFKVGDFIEYSGFRSGTGEILASSIVCISLHITTQAGDNVPNYIRVEDFLVGVPDTAANVEVADIRVVGFLSSCTGSTVTISAIEVDPCTGNETYRSIGTATPKQETRCKWEARIASPAQAPFTREYRITTNTPVKETNDGIKAGQYIQAVSEWIFPEVDVPGTNPPPFPFTGIRGLVQGDFLDGKQYGPLSPFPGSSPPAPSKTCTPEDIPDPNATPTASSTASPDAPQTAPVAAIAGFASAQRVGIDVVLSGSNNATGLNDNDLNFNWTKTSPSSPSVSITNANSPKATFNAPKVTTETSFVFELTVSLKSNATNFSKANVTVKINPTIADNVTMDTYTWESRQSGTIAVTCSSNVKNGDNKGMTLLLNGNTRLTMTKNGGEGKWTYSARSTSRPTNLKCVSDLKGESPLRLGTATTRKRRAIIW